MEVEEYLEACKEGDSSKLQEKIAGGGMNLNIVIGAHQRKMLTPAGKALIGRTPAQLAAMGGHDSCLEILLKHKASPERNDDEIQSPLFAAIGGRTLSPTTTLILSPAPTLPSINASILLSGKSSNLQKTCKILLDAKADVNEEDEDDETNALHQVSIFLIIEPQPSILSSDEKNLTTFDVSSTSSPALNSDYTSKAIDKKRFDLVSWIIDQGANRNDKDVRGFTPLAKAVQAGNLKTVQLLLSKKVLPLMPLKI